MKQRPRIYYSERQKALMWERWRKGETIHQIAKLFDRLPRWTRSAILGPSRRGKIDAESISKDKFSYPNARFDALNSNA